METWWYLFSCFCRKRVSSSQRFSLSLLWLIHTKPNQKHPDHTTSGVNSTLLQQEKHHPFCVSDFPAIAQCQPAPTAGITDPATVG